MINIGICEDDKYFLKEEKQLIVQYLKNKEEKYRVDTFPSGEALLALGKKVDKYDILFLDVNMLEIDGIRTAMEIRRTNNDIFLVFVSAFATYSLEGYKVGAIRFLIKEEGKLETAMKECLDAIFLKKREREWSYVFSFNEGTMRVKFRDIVYVESDVRQVKFILRDNKREEYTARKRLDEIETFLCGKEFIRLHKSYLVNLNCIKNIRRHEAELYNGKIIPISKGRYLEVQSQYLAFVGGL